MIRPPKAGFSGRLDDFGEKPGSGPLGGKGMDEGVGIGNIDGALLQHLHVFMEGFRKNLLDIEAGALGQVADQGLMALEGYRVGILGQVCVGNRRRPGPGGDLLAHAQVHLDRGGLAVAARHQQGDQRPQKQAEELADGHVFPRVTCGPGFLRFRSKGMGQPQINMELPRA
jgi:hypothetical protein